MAVCGYAVGASNPSGGINFNGIGNPMTQSEWVELIRAGAPVLAACIAGVVAWKFGSIQAGIARQQAATAAAAAQTAKSKLKLDLFERRYDMYEFTVRALVSMDQATEDQNAKDMAFLYELRKARWIFGEDVHKFLQEEVWPALLKYRFAQNELKKATERHQFEAAANSISEQQMRLFDLSQKATDIFSPYIRLES